jgi:hypothetical protein
MSNPKTVLAKAAFALLFAVVSVDWAMTAWRDHNVGRGILAAVALIAAASNAWDAVGAARRPQRL